MKRFIALLIAAWFLGLSAGRAQGPDEQYVRIYNLIQEADGLNNNGQPSQALTKFLEVQNTLQKFQRANPQWNVKVVEFRLKYVAAKIAAVSARLPAPPAAPPPAVPPAVPAQSVTLPAVTPPAVSPGPATSPVVPAPVPSARPAVPNDWENQLSLLKDQVRQLEADRNKLELKLKEALSVQPAPLDPRELSRAQEKNQFLQKENDLLKVTLAQEKSKPSVVDAKALAQTQKSLADANRKLSEQTDRANTLAQEKQYLQKKLALLAPVESNAKAFEATKKALADANRQLAEQKDVSARLAKDKEDLQSRIKNQGGDTESAAVLRAENQLLKKQLAEVKATYAAAGKSANPSVQLAQAQAQIAALQSDKDMLRLEKSALEGRVKQLSVPTVTTTVMPAAGRAEDAARIKQLERERDDLQKKLELATKEAFGRKGQATAAHVEEMESQLATLRARLAVFEARQLPYSPEELALFRPPEPKLADPRAGKKSVKDLPPGTVALVAEAQRYFSSKQLDKAEEKYQQVLQQDKKNVPTLANLAAIQLDLNHLDAADTNIKQALAVAPDDAFSLLVLGRLRLRQEKVDEAVDALSRAAKLEPEDAQVQNFLGLALNEKGLRDPAETALRKALQLNPAYGNAHNNLAVMYLSQKPPLVELARWHYQKALAAGFPRNPDLEKMLEARRPIE